MLYLERVTEVIALPKLKRLTKNKKRKNIFTKGIKTYVTPYMVVKELLETTKVTRKIPQEFTLCTYVSKSKIYPYGSEKRGWPKVIETTAG